MGTFEIKGGYQLKGDLHPQGAKNEALQILCAVLLTTERVVIDNIPSIRDVDFLIDLLNEIGVEVEKLGESKYAFQAKEIDFDYLNSEDFKQKGARLRGSIMIIEPIPDILAPMLFSILQSCCK